MVKFRKAIAVCLIAVLGIVSFSSCGKEEAKTSDVPKRTSLKSSVTMSVASGEAYKIVGKISGDIKVNKVRSQQEVMGQIENGQCDFAVMTPIEAARLYNRGADIKVVTTLSLGDWKIAMKDYEEESMDDESMALVSGKYMVGIKDDPMSDELSFGDPEDDMIDNNDYFGVVIEPSNETSNETSDETVTEPEEVVQLKEMSEEVFQALMAKEKLSFFDGQIGWQDLYEASDYLNGYKSIVIGNNSHVEKAVKGIDGFTELYSLSDMWGKEFGKEIPGYVLVATDDFLEKRNYEVEGVLDIIADTLEENQKASELKLVSYNISNRGVSLIRDFLDVLGKYNLDALDGEEIDNDFYWSGK